VVSAQVSPRDLKPVLLAGDRGERVQEVAGGSGQTVEPRYHPSPGADPGQQPAKLRPVVLLRSLLPGIPSWLGGTKLAHLRPRFAAVDTRAQP